MGSGKSTVGRALAAELSLPFVDIDDAIEKREGRSCREIFEQEGEPHFRQVESETTIAELGPPAVVALGGGALGHPRTREALKSTIVLYLEVSFEEALRRTSGSTARPVMAAPNVREIFECRRSLYEDTATMRIRTNGRSPAAIVHEILEGLPRVSTT